MWVTKAALIEVGDDGRLLNSKGVLPWLQGARGETRWLSSDPDCVGGKTDFTDNLEDGMKYRKKN